MSTINLATLLVLLKMNSQQFEEGSDKAKKKTEDLNKMIGGALVGALGLAAKAAVQFGQESVAEFQQFEKGIKEVYTLLPGASEEALGAMREDIIDFSKDVGRTTDETVPALYQAISAGVPQENVFDFMKIASDAALGGVTDLETAVDGISSATNAYGLEALDAQQASDLMFTAVKGGKTTFEELSGSLFNVIPTAASLNVEFGNITAALASMTAQGVPTSVATTQLRQLLVELSKEGSVAAATFEKLAGKSFREFIAEGGNLQGALQIMEQGADDLGVGINDLFGSVEAGSAALSLTGEGTAKFTQELNAAEEAAGATAAAAEVMAGSMEHLEAKANAASEAFKIQMGETLAPLKQWYLETKMAALDYAGTIAAIQQAQRDGNITYAESVKLQGQLTLSSMDSADAMAELEAMTTDQTAAVVQNATSMEAQLAAQTQAAIAQRQAAEAAKEEASAIREAAQARAEAAGINEAFADKVQQTANHLSEEEAMVAAANAANAKYFDELEDGAKAQEEAAAAAKAYEAAVADSFLAALEGSTFFNESLEDLGEQFVTVGGRTAEQNEDLASLREAYDKAAETVRDYELGIKGANLTDEERAAKIAEQQELMAGLASSMDPLLAITGELTAKNVEATVNQDAVNQAIFDAAAAAGGSAAELAILGGALGLYSEEATEAALKSALIQEKINVLAAAYVEGDMSVAQMREELALFINDLDNTAGEMLDTQAGADALTGAASSLGGEIGNVSAAAIEAANSLNGIPTNINVHIGVTSDPVPTFPTGPTGGGQPTKEQAFALGGFTGGMENEIAGLVHGQEFVFSAPAVRAIGLPALEMLHNQGLTSGGNNTFQGTVNNNFYAPMDATAVGSITKDAQLTAFRRRGMR